jgi:hypothetical protein
MGWYATKHALGVYSNEPPERPFAALRPELEPVAPRIVVAPVAAEAIAETGTVIFDRDGTPAYGILFALLADERAPWPRPTTRTCWPRWSPTTSSAMRSGLAPTARSGRYRPIERERISRMISSVPPPIGPSRASR